MKALRIRQPGDAEDLVYEDAPDPEPVTGDVLVEIRGAGFTPTELEWSATWIDHARRDRTPSIPAHEVVVAPSAMNSSPGRRLQSDTPPGETRRTSWASN